LPPPKEILRRSAAGRNRKLLDFRDTTVMRRLFLIKVACLAGLLWFPAKAQDPAGSQPAPSAPDPGEITAVPNRPTFSTSAESVQPGVFEIEYGFELGDGHQNANGLLKFGLTRNLELRFLNNPIERDAGVAGRGDSGAGFKYRFFRQSRVRPTFSLLYTAFL